MGGRVQGMNSMKRPTKVIYGEYWLHQSFCLFEANYLEAYSAEISAIQACQTAGELRRLVPNLKLARSPVDPEEDLAEYRDDDPWNWKNTGAASEGDWPGMPTSAALELFAANDPIWRDLIEQVDCERVTTVFSGDYLHIPLDKEAELLSVLAKYGIEARRNDKLIEPLGMP